MTLAEYRQKARGREQRRAPYPATANGAASWLQVRAATVGTGVDVIGYASITGTPYDVTDFMGDYAEVMAPGVFTKSLAEQDDVRLLLNHDGLPLARTRSGTLQMSEVMNPRQDPMGLGLTGLYIEASLDARSSMVNDVMIALERGDLSQMSIAFQATRQSWSPDYDQRTISEAKLFDASLVTYPASPTTVAQAVPRSARALNAIAKISARALTDPERTAIAQALGALNGVDSIVDELLEDLAGLLGVPNPDDDEMDEASTSALQENADPMVTAEYRRRVATLLSLAG